MTAESMSKLKVMDSISKLLYLISLKDAIVVLLFWFYWYFSSAPEISWQHYKEEEYITLLRLC